MCVGAAELIQNNKRMVDQSIQAMDRDRSQLEKDECILIAQIRRDAKAGRLDLARTQAKDLIRIQKQQKKFSALTSHLRAVSMRVSSMASSQALQESLHKVTESMTTLNKQMDLPQLQEVTREFARQNLQMEFKQDHIGDVIEETMDEAEDEEESDQVINQVLDGIGIDMSRQLVSVPTKPPPTEVSHVLCPLSTSGGTDEVMVQPVLNQEDRELQERLNSLGR